MGAGGRAVLLGLIPRSRAGCPLGDNGPWEAGDCLNGP